MRASVRPAKRQAQLIQTAGPVAARIREADLGAIHFAWAGPVESAAHAHYFRLHGTRLLVEHDNTQTP